MKRGHPREVIKIPLKLSVSTGFFSTLPKPCDPPEAFTDAAGKACCIRE
jgi:hypothetical protein